MAFATKTDWIGLASDTLKLKSNGDGASNGNLEIVGTNGNIVANETYGHIKAPTCEYVICGTEDINFDIGVSHSTAYPTYVLQSYSVSTGAGQEPTFSAAAVQIEEDSTRTFCIYTPSIIKLSPARHASDFGAVTGYVESGSLVLQTGNYSVGAEISPSTINGDPVASDAVKGKETVVLTYWTNSDTTPPTVTADDEHGWRMSSDWACTGADSSMFSWTATFERYLTATPHS